MFSEGPDDIDRQIDRWATQIQEKAQQYQRLKDDLTQITGTATAANGAVTVTVGPSGLLQRLDITDDIRTMHGRYLSEQIMTAIRKAQSTLGAQVTELMRERVGNDTASIDTVARNYATQFPDIVEDKPSDNRRPGDEDSYFDEEENPFRFQHPRGF
jgi:DNA-binding protein YbaB